jgi:PBP1b-binding outer membrane lipoprotein LpoB
MKKLSSYIVVAAVALVVAGCTTPKAEVATVPLKTDFPNEVASVFHPEVWTSLPPAVSP